MDDSPLSRRRALRTGSALLAAAVAGCPMGDGDGSQADGASPTTATTDGESGGTTATDTDATAPPETDDETAADPGDETPAETPVMTDLGVAAERVAAGFTSPVGLEIPEPERRFVVDQAGQIFVQDGADADPEPFLDLRDRIVDVGGYDERGLLGLAFHPQFGDNGRFFVRYSAPNRAGTTDSYAHTFVLSEFRADPGAATADPGSERTVLEIPQPQGNHNSGAIAFGPDGHLYVGTGDGGAANDEGDGHVDDWYDANAGGNGQDVTENLLGSILRIDVDADPDAGAGEVSEAGDNARDYAIPEDNPLVGEEGLDEHFAWGFRNPWRMSFGPDGRLYVADVGQNEWEEVNVVEAGGNYGWNVREGAHCFGADDCPTETPDGRPLVDPVIEYPNGQGEISGAAVVGGYRYRGEDLADLEDLYVFADWRAQGRLFAAAETGDGQWPLAEVSVDADEQFGPNVLSFGRNPDGELFVCTTAEDGVQGDTGAVFRLHGE